MSRLLIGHDETVASWVSTLIGKQFSSPYSAIGMIGHDGKLIGGAVFTSYTGDAVELSLAGKGSMTREAWRSIVHYVFEQLKCSRLTIHTSATNKRARKMAPRFGFVFEGTARNLFGKHNGLCYSLVSNDLPALRARWRL